MLSNISVRYLLRSKEPPIEEIFKLASNIMYLQVQFILVKLMYSCHVFFINASDYIFFVFIKEVL